MISVAEMRELLNRDYELPVWLERACRWLKRLALAIAVVLSVFVLLWYVQFRRPYVLMCDWGSNGEKIDAGVRRAAHQQLFFPIGLHHDAFVVLGKIGNADSVPLLVRALKWQDEVQNGFAVCTTAHCLWALRSLTGEYPGDSYEDWDKWWRAAGVEMSRTNFYPRAANDASAGEGPPDVAGSAKTLAVCSQQESRAHPLDAESTD